MCGIVGYKGKTKSLKFVISTLKKLEYRGYDSAGVASLKNGKIETFKESGNISKLDAVVPEMFETNCSIAHTRWATHGKPNQLNAHPHSSKNKTWTIVHNGIVENYLSLKEKLTSVPESETDTSVVAELLEEKQAQTFDEFIDVFALVDGSYAILALNKNKEDEMFLAKNKSPLYVSQNETGDFLIASDPICFVDFGKSYYVFGDGEFAHIDGKEIIFKNAKKQTIKKEKIEMDSIFADASQGEYKHFMLKEIMEQPTAVQRLVNTVRDNDVLSKFQNGWIKNFDEVKFIGCGTAYHAGLVGARYVSKIAGIPASAEVASEFIYNTPVFAGPKKLFVFVSQSGETADTLSAVKIAKEHGSTCIALT
ncbi:MAG: SIS domain-containing protein, partial [Clostridia bacterium]|nr:SIS domain-containing protein [Clostridia bacterium]